MLSPNYNKNRIIALLTFVITTTTINSGATDFITAAPNQGGKYPSNFLIAFPLKIKEPNGFSESAFNLGVLDPNTNVTTTLNTGFIASPNSLIFSPDGSTFQFNNIFEHLNGKWDVMTIATSISWSPDGKAIAFVHQQNVDNMPFPATGDLYITPSANFNNLLELHQPPKDLTFQSLFQSLSNEDLTTVTQLTHDLPVLVSAVWSPDTQNLAFTSIDSSIKEKRNTSIYVMRANGMGLRFLTIGVAPAWSHNGKMIAYADYNSESMAIIGIIDLDTGNKIIVPSSPDQPSFHIGWSADDQSLIFTYLQSGRYQNIL